MPVYRGGPILMLLQLSLLLLNNPVVGADVAQLSVSVSISQQLGWIPIAHPYLTDESTFITVSLKAVSEFAGGEVLIDLNPINTNEFSQLGYFEVGPLKTGESQDSSFLFTFDHAGRYCMIFSFTPLSGRSDQVIFMAFGVRLDLDWCGLSIDVLDKGNFLLLLIGTGTFGIPTIAALGVLGRGLYRRRVKQKKTSVTRQKTPLVEKPRPEEQATMWDLFICHASEDKNQVARPLAEALTRKGLRVWYDEFTLTVGDSLNRSIDYGLANSRFGVVILSPSFFGKEWPRRELDGLTAKEIQFGKTILPVWHNVDRGFVIKFSPVLADKLAVSTSTGLNNMVKGGKVIELSRKSEIAIKMITEMNRMLDSIGIPK